MTPTDKILDRFEQVAAIPRQTKHEEQIARWLQDWAAGRNYPAKRDAAGNLVISVPASPGYEGAPVIVLQGHMDMVCVKVAGSPHDFARDPIRCVREGEWLHADGTTLGADNGIAIAIILTLVDDPAVEHPPLELLLTVEEEIGISGATKMASDMLTGRILINLDSEQDGVFTIGCAGGLTTNLDLPVVREAVPAGWTAVRVSAGGLQGGHSGVDIHKHRGNAVRFLARTLDRLRPLTEFRLASMKGGVAHNVIARECEATIVLPAAALEAVRQAVPEFDRSLGAEYSHSEHGIAIEAAPVPVPASAADAASTARTIDLLLALPHGVAEMSASIEGFVETSNNLAAAELAADGTAVKLMTSQRSMVTSRLEEINHRIESIARLAGASVNHIDAYPAWRPDVDSELLKRSVGIYKRLFGSEPEVSMIHAGLECGSIGAKYDGIDMISLGPTITGAHSPNEQLHIPTVGRVWDLLVELLKSYKPA